MFWQLCRTFMQSFVELVTEMKNAKDLRLLAQEIIIVLKPVQKASREAGRLVETSPWGYMTETSVVDTPVTASDINGFDGYGSALNGFDGHYPTLPASHLQIQPTVAIQSTVPFGVPSSQPPSTGASPVPAQLLATPLSAALGPAAQATVPSASTGSTPASAHADGFFSGNVFQRADALLSMQQAGNFPFPGRKQNLQQL